MARKKGKKLFTFKFRKKKYDVGLKKVSREKAQGIAIGTAVAGTVGLFTPIAPEILLYGAGAGATGLLGYKGFKALKKKKWKK